MTPNKYQNLFNLLYSEHSITATISEMDAIINECSKISKYEVKNAYTFNIPYLTKGMNGEGGLIREHFKYAKELSLYLPLNHHKRIKVNDELNKMLKIIHKLKKL